MYSSPENSSGSSFLAAEEEEEKLPALEVGTHAVWSLSSCKPGFGVAHLRDGSTDTYWQSDGPQPHLVNIQFLKKTAVQRFSLYVNYKMDESYTPSKIAVKVGSNFHDLLVTVIELDEPEGWIHIDLDSKDERPVRGFHYQLVVLSNHQNGRDTHVRQIKVFEPESSRTSSGINGTPGFEGVDFLAMRGLR